MPATITSQPSFVATYDRSGRALSLFRSEQAQRVAAMPDQGSTTTENYKDKVTLSASGAERSRQTPSPKKQEQRPAPATQSARGEQDKEQVASPQSLTLSRPASADRTMAAAAATPDDLARHDGKSKQTATGHSLSETDRDPATCTENGLPESDDQAPSARRSRLLHILA